MFSLFEVMGFGEGNMVHLSHLCVLISGLLLLRGTDQFFEKKTSRHWITLGAAGIFWIHWGWWNEAPFVVETFPIFFLYAVISIYTGFTILHSSKTIDLGRQFAGWGFVLWGLHKIDYPFMRHLEWFAPWGFMIGGLFGLIVSLGMLLAYFQKVRNELLESEEHFRVLLETNPHGVIECDTEGRITFANTAYCTMKGLPLEDILGRTIWDMALFQEGRDAIYNNFAVLSHSYGGPVSHVIRNIGKGDEHVWRRLDWNRISGVGGDVRGFIAVVTDVTEERQAREYISSTNAALNTLLQSAPLPLFSMDMSGNVVHWNPAAEAVFGWTEDEVIGKKCPFLVAGSREEFESFYAETLGGERITGAESRLLRKDGTPVNVVIYISPLYGNTDEITGSIAILEDISGRIEMEEALRQSERNYKDLVERSPYPMFVHSRGNFVYLNPAAVRLFSVDSNVDLVGKPLSEFISSEGHRWFSQSATSGGNPGDVRYFEVMASPSEGLEIDIEVTDIRLNYGGQQASLAICSDVSEQKAMLSELLKSEARYRGIVQDQTEFIVRWRSDGSITFVNGSLCRNSATTPENLIGKSFYSLFTPDKEFMFEEFHALLTPENPVSQVMELPLPKVGGGETWQEWQTRAIFDNLGNLLEYHSVGRDITKRRRAEIELHSQTALLQTIVDAIPSPVFYKDPDGVYLGCNRAFENYLGYPRDRIVGHMVYDLAPKDLADIYHEADLRLLRQGGAQMYETSVVFADGKRHDVIFHKATFSDPNGETAGMVGTMLDISERKRLEELVFSIARGISPDTGEPFFRSVVKYLALSLSADIAFIAETDSGEMSTARTIAVFKDGALSENFDYPLETSPIISVIRDGIFLYASHVSSVRERFPNDTFLAAEKVEAFVGIPLLDSSGLMQGVLVVLFRNPLDKSKMIESLLQIVAVRVSSEMERRKSQQILEVSEERYRNLYKEFLTLLDAISDPLILVSPDYKVIWSNSAARLSHETGALEAQYCCVQQNCSEMYGDICPTGRSFKTGEKESSQIVTNDGKIWELRTFPVKDETGGVSGVMEMRIDISEKVRLQKENARTGQLVALGELAAGVAHEINNPITGVINFAQILSNRSQKGSREEDIAQRIIREGDRIAAIVGKLLAFARKSGEEKKFVSVREILTDVLTLFEAQLRRDGISMEVDLPLDLPLVYACFQQIQQVFMNILSNARYALNSRYPQPDERKQLRIHGEALQTDGGTWVKISFTDHGCGIPASILEKIMNPFFTTKPSGEGTGLGLSISHEIIADHSGRIEAESSEGEYTRIDVILPFGREKGSINA